MNFCPFIFICIIKLWCFYEIMFILYGRLKSHVFSTLLWCWGLRCLWYRKDIYWFLICTQPLDLIRDDEKRYEINFPSICPHSLTLSYLKGTYMLRSDLFIIIIHIFGGVTISNLFEIVLSWSPFYIFCTLFLTFKW